MHAAISGVAHFVSDGERTCLEDVRYLLCLLPSNNREVPVADRPGDPPDRRTDVRSEIVPTDGNRPYDVRRVLAEIVDDGDYFEVSAARADAIVRAFARPDGHTVGIVADQPWSLVGVLDLASSEKAARFFQFCDAFTIPLVTFVDVPGLLSGVGQEHGGIILHDAKLLYAYRNATVPRVSVALRRAYGGAYIVLDSRAIGAGMSLA